MKKNNYYLTLLALLLLVSGCKPNVGGKDPSEIVTSQTKLDHLVIWEVFYSGSWRERVLGKKNYGYADQNAMYIKIFNPTEEPKYLDGLCIAISQHQTTNFSEIKLEKPEDNFFKTHFAMDEILQFPGSGKEYVIKPGETILVAKMASDFTKPNPNLEDEDVVPYSFDLTKADFEWFSTADQFENVEYTDNPSVPNLKRNFYYYESDGLDPTNRTLVLFEIKDNKYLEKLSANDAEYFKDYTITEYNTNTSYDLEVNAPVVPNAWIIDAVSIAPINDYKMQTISEDLDAGWFGVSQHIVNVSHMNKEDANLAIRRKWNGKSYEDTNNSSIDFEVVPASLKTAKEGASESH